jgi:hypothetical protein
MEPTRSIERTQSILRIQAVEKGSRREAIKTAKADRINALEYTPTALHCATVRAPTALPARQGALWLRMEFCRDAIRSSGGGRRRTGNGGGPNTGGRGTVGRR